MSSLYTATSRSRVDVASHFHVKPEGEAARSRPFASRGATFAWLAVLAGLLASTGCGGDSGAAPGALAAGAPGPAGSGIGGSGGLTAPPMAAGTGPAGQSGAGSAGKVSFATVYERVIRARCAQCHNDGPSFGGLALFPGAMTAYSNLVGVPAGGEPTFQCRNSGLLRVQPGAPEQSLLYLKLTAPTCGSKMPPLAFGTITAEQLELVRQWIADGAAP